MNDHRPRQPARVIGRQRFNGYDGEPPELHVPKIKTGCWFKLGQAIAVTITLAFTALVLLLLVAALRFAWAAA